MDTINHKVFKFQGFLLDVRGRSLRNGAHDIKLRPKSFDVLCILVASAGRLLTKDEVIDAVWPNVTVTDESLAQCVRDIRLALHDFEHRIIKTVPRRGYVFATPALRAAIDDRPEPPLANAIEKRAAATRRDGRRGAPCVIADGVADLGRLGCDRCQPHALAPTRWNTSAGAAFDRRASVR